MQLDLSLSSPLQAKTVAVHERLCQMYGCPIAYFSQRDPLSELVSALLSHRTKNAASRRAYHQLRERFGSWQGVQQADLAAVSAAVAPCTWPEQKAARIQQVLGDIAERRDGELSLDFLADWEVAAARHWLEEISGIGPKTSAAVLAFSTLRRRALPVDSHHHRVAQRLGLIPQHVAVGPAHGLLEALLPLEWSAQQVYDHHEVLMLHGQRCCHFRRPSCDRCCVRDHCHFFQGRQEYSKSR